jgi:hypothetical protein
MVGCDCRRGVYRLAAIRQGMADDARPPSVRPRRRDAGVGSRPAAIRQVMARRRPRNGTPRRRDVGIGAMAVSTPPEARSVNNLAVRHVTGQ